MRGYQQFNKHIHAHSRVNTCVMLSSKDRVENICTSIVFNGRSLSGMGLTRERWSCAGFWWNRLDMNTCQTSIKTDILL